MIVSSGIPDDALVKLITLSRNILRTSLAGACLLAATTLEGATALLELERSTNNITWEKVPLAPEHLTAKGGVLQNTHDPKAFYRLRIQDNQLAGFVTALPLNEAPTQAVEIAKQFMAELFLEDAESEGGDPEGNWADAELGPVCYPVYDPAVEGGRTPAYIEFKVIRKTPPTVNPSPNDPFGMSPPDTSDDDCDRGHLLVALTRSDFPVPSFSQRGATPVELLLRKARTTGPVKPVRFDDGLLIGEDAAGEVVGSIGNTPFLMDEAILNIAGKEFVGSSNEQTTVDDNGPSFPARGYASYREFKKDFDSSPLYVELRRLRAKSAAGEWNAVLGIEPTSIRVPLKVRTKVLEDRRVQKASLADPEIAALTVPTDQMGLWVTGEKAGGSALEVTYVDGTSETFLLFAGTLIKPGTSLSATTAGWTSWKYWYAGTWNDQRRYQQYHNDAQMCPGGASGCGPAAWAMLYGWWDRKGSPRLIKSISQADSPLSNDDSIRDCNRYVFDQVGPFCVSGQAATMPWNMKAGRHWAAHRGAGRDITWSWGLPYASFGSLSRVADSIKAGRPSIVGLGYYWHYPLAYGYKARQYKTGSIVWSTQRYFKCNMGWGGDSAQWHNANSTWFGTHARYW